MTPPPPHQYASVHGLMSSHPYNKKHTRFPILSQYVHDMRVSLI